MKSRTGRILSWSLGFAFSCLFIWAVSAVFLDSVSPKAWDDAVGRYVNQPGTAIRHRSEGWAELEVAEHGLTPEGRQVFDSPQPKYLFWGDSYAEAMQVRTEDRAVSLYNARAQASMPKGVVIADSGLSMADFYFYIPRYESLTSNVVAHVFLLAGLRNITPGGHIDCHSRFLPDPWRFEHSECEPSEAALAHAALINRSKLDFLYFIYRSVADCQLRFSVGHWNEKQPVVREQDAALTLDELEEAWTYLLSEFKKETSAKLVFLYAPPRPTLSKGEIVYEDQDAKAQKALFSRLCRQAGADFVDLSSAFVRLYEQTGRLSTGFFNTPNGVGHFNEAGQALVAQGLRDYFAGDGK